LRLPEQFETRVRATAFAFCTSFARFVGAGVNFLLGAAVLHTYAGSAGCADGDRFRDRTFHHPDGARDARQSASPIGV